MYILYNILQDLRCQDDATPEAPGSDGTPKDIESIIECLWCEVLHIKTKNVLVLWMAECCTRIPRSWAMPTRSSCLFYSFDHIWSCSPLNGLHLLGVEMQVRDSNLARVTNEMPKLPDFEIPSLTAKAQLESQCRQTVTLSRHEWVCKKLMVHVNISSCVLLPCRKCVQHGQTTRLCRNRWTLRSWTLRAPEGIDGEPKSIGVLWKPQLYFIYVDLQHGHTWMLPGWYLSSHYCSDLL